MRVIFPLVVAVYPAIWICQGLVKAIVIVVVVVGVVVVAIVVAIVVVILGRRGLGGGSLDPEGCGFQEMTDTRGKGGRRRRRRVICRQRAGDT